MLSRREFVVSVAGLPLSVAVRAQSPPARDDVRHVVAYLQTATR
jgi:hypothetical protein